MNPTKKQIELLSAYKSGKFNIFALGGGAGSAKTIGILFLLDSICEVIPNARIAVFRKSEKNLKNNTIPSFKKLHKMLGKNIPIRDMKAKYPNGSEMLFLWADITKDPDCDNAKGGEFTIAYLNEANQIDQKYFEILKTRVGRWNTFEVNDQKIKLNPAIFLDFNPSDNWVKNEFYDLFTNEKLPKNIYFQLSLPSDNPYLETEYWDMLKTLPESEYNRYVKGLWDYGDDPNQLIQWEWLKPCLNENIEMPINGRNVLSIDPAREGDDKTVFCYGKENKFYRFEEFSKQDPTKSGMVAIERMAEHKIKANSIIIDSVGLGAGTVDILRHKGYNPHQFIGGAEPKSKIEFFNFKNLRAEGYWYLREAIRKGDIEIIDNKTLQKDLISIRYFSDEKVIRIESKEQIKKRLHKSPDYGDALMMANFLRVTTLGQERNFFVGDERKTSDW